MLASSFGASSTSAIRLASFSASSFLKPRVVMAGEPMRMPLVTKGFSRIVGDGVLVHGDVRAAERRLGFLAGDFLGAQVHQEHVAFGAPGNDAQAPLLQDLGHHAGIVQHLLLVVAERRRPSLP